jgi:glycosyltransferase involved in cell wall biosynthesis
MTDQPLRILAVINIPWDPRLGAARVWIELAEEWMKAGHTVETFCLTDAFSAPTNSRVVSVLRQLWFPRRAAHFIRRHADRFDVIDFLIGTLPFPKKNLRFKGLLVARSVGLFRLYDEFTRRSRDRWPDQPEGKLLGRFFYKVAARLFRHAAERSIHTCDLINVPNENEAQDLDQHFPAHRPVTVQPYGLDERARTALASAAEAPAIRLAKKKVSFIGMWSLRKGSRDWPEIIRKIRREMPEAEFVFLGTMFSEEVVFEQLGLSPNDRVICKPTYEPSELPALLSDCTVGLFPSYIEGFGLAVLEQMAAGIPTIAYDVPGPRQILHDERSLLLTPEGDVEVIAARAIAILRMDGVEYEKLTDRCRAIADQFRWDEFAAATLRDYRAALARTGAGL